MEGQVYYSAIFTFRKYQYASTIYAGRMGKNNEAYAYDDNPVNCCSPIRCDKKNRRKAI